MAKKYLRISLNSSRGKFPCVALLEGEQLYGNLKEIISDFEKVVYDKLLPVLCLLGSMVDQYPSGTLVININNQEMDCVEIKTTNAKLSSESLEKAFLEMQILSQEMSNQICKKVPYCLMQSDFSIIVKED